MRREAWRSKNLDRTLHGCDGRDDFSPRSEYACWMHVCLLIRFVFNFQTPGGAAIILQSRCPQAAHAMPVDGTLPREEFLNRQCISCASLLETNQAGANPRHNLSLAPDHPALRARRRKVFQPQPMSVENYADGVLLVQLQSH